MSKERDEFMIALARELPGLPIHHVSELGRRIMRQGATLKRLAEALCNYMQQDEYERKCSPVKARLSGICVEHNLHIVTQNDPRGPTLRMLFKQVRGNCFGDDKEYAVPGS